MMTPTHYENVADMVLELLEVMRDKPHVFEDKAEEEGISVEQLAASAISAMINESYELVPRQELN